MNEEETPGLFILEKLLDWLTVPPELNGFFSSIRELLSYPILFVALIICGIVWAVTICAWYIIKHLLGDIKEAIARIGLWPATSPRFSLGAVGSALGVIAMVLIYHFVPQALQGAQTGWFYSIMTILTFLIFYYVKTPAETTFPFLEHGPILNDIPRNYASGFEYVFQGVIHLVWSFLAMIKGGVEYFITYTVGEWIDKIRHLSNLELLGGGTILLALVLIGYFGIYKANGDKISSWLTGQNNMYALAGCLLGFLILVYFVGQFSENKALFPRAALFVFGLLLALSTFSITKADSYQGKSNAIVFACLVLPVIPIFVLLFRHSSWFAHIVSLIAYATIAFVVVVMNPGGILPSESYDSGQVYMVTILCALALVAIVLNIDFLQEDWGEFVTKFGIGMVSLCVLAGGVTMVVNLFKSGEGNAPQTILLLGIIVVAAAYLIFYLFKDVKFRDLISYVDYFSKFNLFLKTLMVIPCLIADVFAFFAKEWAGWLLLIVELLLIVWYLFLSKPTYRDIRSSPNGQELVREPVTLSKPRVIPVAEYTYSYALSFWLKLKPMNPDVHPTATEFVNLVSYGSRPAISYNASTNTIRVTMKAGKSKEIAVPGDDYRNTSLMNAAKEFLGQKPDTQIVETTEDVDVLVADFKNVDLQKWSHFVFYYNDGKLNIFQNGELVKTVRAAATNLAAPIVVGDEKGNKGELCSLFFFQNKKVANDALFLGGEAITADKIKTLYLDFKDRSPPIIDRIFKVETKSV